MASRTTPRAQTSFDENSLKDPALEALLDQRYEADLARKPLDKTYRELHAAAKAAIEHLELPNGLHRCGRFVIKVSPVGEREISFELPSRINISITPAKT